MLKTIEVVDNKCTLTLDCSVNIANALRRSLISDVYTYCPESVHVRTNTSCQTDEYIAHRIGLIPFLHKDKEECSEHEICSINVQDRTITTDDIVGGFVSSYKLDIMKLINGQKFDADIYFKKGTGAEHAKFSPVSSVGYDILEDGLIKLMFESINLEDPVIHLLKSLQSILNRLYNVRYQLETK